MARAPDPISTFRPGAPTAVTERADPSGHVERLEWLERPLDPEALDPNDFAENLRSLRLTTFDHLG